MKLKKIIEKLKKMRKDFFNPWWRAKKRYIKYYENLEIDDKIILLEASHGGNINGNMFYLAKYLCTNEQYKDYTVYFCARAKNIKQYRSFFAAHGIDNIEMTILASDDYFQLLSSAKYLINDTTFGPYFLKKEGQVYLNTWHGTPLKALGRKNKGEPHEISNVQNNFLKADYILFPNEYTKDIIIEDYMLANISSGSYVMSGYPRNEAFFDEQRKDDIRTEMELLDKKVYAYLPTFRGAASKGGTPKNAHYLNYFLYELDKRLQDDEVFYLNLHPLAKRDVNFSNFEHIKNFPDQYETYEFLNAADVLITDYSSVFFDYVTSGNKIVLFMYDKDEYLQDRGMYMDVNELPFPQVVTPDELISELRRGKNYDDTAFLEKFCKYDCADASKKLCDQVILGTDTGLEICKIPSNGKENVLLYAGNLSGNGITASLRNLLNCIDLDKRNYYFNFYTNRVRRYSQTIATFPEKAYFYGMTENENLTVLDLFIRKAFRMKFLSASLYMKLQSKRIRHGMERTLSGAKFDHYIHFNGYEDDVTLAFSTFTGKNSIFVHSDMVQEIKTRGNQRKDVLQYAYNQYKYVAPVSDAVVSPTIDISGGSDNIRVVKNMINYESIRERSAEEMAFDSTTKSTIEFADLKAILESPSECFINVGRFSPEKGQDRLVRAFARYHKDQPDSYLIIMGGSTLFNTYNKLIQLAEELGISEHLVLIEGVSNPFPIMKACDYFVFSSFYESFGLVIAEADIVGLPVISTDIAGPRVFMEKYGGTMVEDSEEGLYKGMHMLHNGEIKPMNVDYEVYNRETAEQFDRLFE